MVATPDVTNVNVDPATDSEADVAMSDRVADELATLGCAVVESHLAQRRLVCGQCSGLSLRMPEPDGAERINSRAALPYQVSRRDPLGRAIGKTNTHVVDATAGLGGDTLLLSMMGLHVVAIEQSPILFVILRDRIDNMLTVEQRSRVRLCFGDSQLLLPTLPPPVDVVYLDPMFPPRRKTSALPKKELMELRELAAKPASGSELLNTALGVAVNRVVVKRLPESEPIGRAPDWQHQGKTVRYDVYASQSAARERHQ